MTVKELILDSLIDDDEARTEIKAFLDFCETDIAENELDRILDEMLAEGLISINYEWKNEKGESPYSLTGKGRDAWKNIVA